MHAASVIAVLAAVLPQALAWGPDTMAFCKPGSVKNCLSPATIPDTCSTCLSKVEKGCSGAWGSDEFMGCFCRVEYEARPFDGIETCVYLEQYDCRNDAYQIMGAYAKSCAAWKERQQPMICPDTYHHDLARFQLSRWICDDYGKDKTTTVVKPPTTETTTKLPAETTTKLPAETTTTNPKPTGNKPPQPSHPTGPLSNGTLPGTNVPCHGCPKPTVTKSTTVCPEGQKPTTLPGTVPTKPDTVPSKPDTSAPAIVPIAGAASAGMSGLALLVAGVAALL